MTWSSSPNACNLFVSFVFFLVVVFKYERGLGDGVFVVVVNAVDVDVDVVVDDVGINSGAVSNSDCVVVVDVVKVFVSGGIVTRDKFFVEKESALDGLATGELGTLWEVGRDWESVRRSWGEWKTGVESYKIVEGGEDGELISINDSSRTNNSLFTSGILRGIICKSLKLVVWGFIFWLVVIKELWFGVGERLGELSSVVLEVESILLGLVRDEVSSNAKWRTSRILWSSVASLINN